MDAYIYQAALLCGTCAKDARSKLNPELLALADQDSNSDLAPQGPFPQGGGAADSPQSCDHCGAFLENPLTPDGYAYAKEQAANPDSDNSVIREWVAFYDLDSDD